MGTYIFTEIERRMNKEICGHGIVHVIILHMLLINRRQFIDILILNFNIFKNGVIK